MNLIKTKKKQLMTQILISTKSACIKLLDHKEIDLKQPTQSIDTPLNIIRPKKTKQENNILNMTPISQSSPYANTNEISKIRQRNISEFLENTPKVFITDTTPSSIKCNNQQENTSKINIKCNMFQQSKATPIQAPQKLMSLNTKPSRQLEDMLNNMHEKSDRNSSISQLNLPDQNKSDIEDTNLCSFDFHSIISNRTIINYAHYMKCNDCAKRLNEEFLHRLECKYCTGGWDALLSDEPGYPMNHSIIIEEGIGYYSSYNDTYDDTYDETYDDDL